MRNIEIRENTNEVIRYPEDMYCVYFHQDPALSTIQNPAFVLILCTFRSAFGLLRRTDRYGSGN